MKQHLVVKSLGFTVINTLVRTLGYGMDHLTPMYEIDDSNDLQKDLEKDPIISSALFFYVKYIINIVVTLPPLVLD